MIDLMKRDYRLYGKKILWLIPVMSVSLIMLFPEGDEGYFIIGLPLVFLTSLLLFVQEDKSQGIQMLLKQPFSKLEIVRGRYASAWMFMGITVLYMIALGFFLGLFYSEALPGFMSYLNPTTLFIYLWFLSILSLAFFPIMFIFLGRGIQAFLMLILGMNVLLGAFFMMSSGERGPDLFLALETLLIWMQSAHSGLAGYALSLLGLILVNTLSVSLSAWIFGRREF